eukprot:g15188.t1
MSMTIAMPGFGRLSNVTISPGELEQLQVNLIRSHATGVGKALPLGAARRVMALRINTLLKGCSGISLQTFQQLVNFFNSGLVPYVRDQGTVGASGDLVPLAHIALNVLGEGECFCPRRKTFTKITDALLKEYNLTKTTLQAKDGLALINGTQFICGVGCEAIALAIQCVKCSHVAAAMTLVALNGHPEAYDAQIAQVRGHVGQIVSAQLMRHLVPAGSIDNARNPDCQDAYSLRCLPQVHGCVLENIANVKREFETEINAATDNPLIFGDTQRMLSGGNFHAEYVAKALDVLAIYVHELSSISYSRVMRLLNPHKNNDSYPAFLIRSAGLSSGFMTWENVAASLVSENKVLCHPSSVDSLSTCADKEDHVSMGGFSARKANKVAKNVARTIAIELLAATQAIYLMLEEAEDSTSSRTAEAEDPLPPLVRRSFEFCRRKFPKLVEDRYTVGECDAIYEAVLSGELYDAVFAGVDLNDEPESSAGEENSMLLSTHRERGTRTTGVDVDVEENRAVVTVSGDAATRRRQQLLKAKL